MTQSKELRHKLENSYRKHELTDSLESSRLINETNQAAEQAVSPNSIALSPDNKSSGIGNHKL